LFDLADGNAENERFVRESMDDDFQNPAFEPFRYLAGDIADLPPGHGRPASSSLPVHRSDWDAQQLAYPDYRDVAASDRFVRCLPAKTEIPLAGIRNGHSQRLVIVRHWRRSV
jgi:hypothetical protein